MNVYHKMDFFSHEVTNSKLHDFFPVAEEGLSARGFEITRLNTYNTVSFTNGKQSLYSVNEVESYSFSAVFLFSGSSR